MAGPTMTSAEHREDAFTRAAETFANHKIEPICVTERVKVYKCSREGTNIHHFFVSILPGAILVHGDIGELLLDRVYGRGLGWLRSSVHSLGYLLEKSSGTRKTEFMPGDARNLIADTDYYSDEIRAAIAREWSGEAEDWDETVYDLTGDFEYPRCRDYSFTTLWCVGALRWFVANLPVDEAAEVA